MPSSGSPGWHVIAPVSRITNYATLTGCIACATGLIEERDNGHEIVVTNLDSITIGSDLPALPPFFPDAHRPCGPGVELPKLRREVRPSYTQKAMRDQVEGRVVMEAVVETNGRIESLRVIRYLHEDLDAAAARALRQWRFTPGTVKGEPVPVVVTVEMTFTLRR